MEVVAIIDPSQISPSTPIRPRPAGRQPNFVHKDDLAPYAHVVATLVTYEFLSTVAVFATFNPALDSKDVRLGRRSSGAIFIVEPEPGDLLSRANVDGHHTQHIEYQHARLHPALPQCLGNLEFHLRRCSRIYLCGHRA